MFEEGLIGNGLWLNSVEMWIGEYLFDVIGYSYKEVFYLEFEICIVDMLLIIFFIFNVQCIIVQVQLYNDIVSLFSNVIDELCWMIGYDWVMVYCFCYDDFGEVVVESCCEDFESYLG